MSDEMSERLGPALAWSRIQKRERKRIVRDARLLAKFSKMTRRPVVTWTPLRCNPRDALTFGRLYSNEN